MNEQQISFALAEAGFPLSAAYKWWAGDGVVMICRHWEEKDLPNKQYPAPNSDELIAEIEREIKPGALIHGVDQSGKDPVTYWAYAAMDGGAMFKQEGFATLPEALARLYLEIKKGDDV